jgi:subtilase family serine protease
MAAMTLGLPGAEAAAEASGAVAIPGTAPVVGSNGAAERPATSSETTEVHLFLGRDQSGLEALDEQVADAHSNSYGHFLTAAQVAADFGATPQYLDTLTSWLRSQGLRITYRSPYLVSASGTSRSVAKTFSTRVVPSEAGQVTNATTMRMPARLAAQVVTITVTSTRPVAEKPKWVAAGTASRADCSQYYGQRKAQGVPPAYGQPLTWAPCGYSPSQLRSALSAQASGFTGQGVTVAIISGDDDSTAFADANAQARRDHFPSLPASRFVAYVEPGSSNGVGDVESALDVESVHAAAPGATIAYVAGGDGATDEPTLNALEQIVSNHLAQVVTDSWGVNRFSQGTELGFTNALQRAGVEGITVDTASGDVGSNPTLSYLFPASDPWLTTVGGTSLAIGQGGRYLWQTGWEDGTAKDHDGTWSPNPPGKFFGGSTGGVSTLFQEPYYQQGIATGNVVNGTAMEEYPDMADVADPYTGYSIGWTPTLGHPMVYETVGGTSMASPLFAATEADVIQARHGAALGFANPLLYGFYGSQAFNDVTDSPQGTGVTEAVAFPAADGTPAELGTLGQAQLTGLVCGPGFDDVTGLGTPSSQFFTLLQHG